MTKDEEVSDRHLSIERQVERLTGSRRVYECVRLKTGGN